MYLHHNVHMIFLLDIQAVALRHFLLESKQSGYVLVRCAGISYI